MAGLRAAHEALADGEMVAVFPEGGITSDGKLKPGQRGAARLARRTGAPVLPLGVRGAIRTYSKLQTFPRRHRVEVHRGPVMHYDETDDREGEKRFTDRLMAEIQRLAYG